MNRLKLKDIAPFSTITGYYNFVFTRIANQFSSRFEWLTNSLGEWLDDKLIIEYSGDKYVSRYVQKLIELKDDGKIEGDIFTKVCQNIVLTYENKWNRLHNALVENDYEPLENYNMIQVETPDVTKEKTTDVKTRMVTSSSGDSSNDVYGFNSANPSPSTENNANTEVVVSGDNDENVSHDLETESGTRELTRHGNIGVTTSQQMLESEIKLRNDYNFVKILLDDVTKILCNFVY